MQEQRRLEAALSNEQHLRTELEMDLQERNVQIQERGKTPERVDNHNSYYVDEDVFHFLGHNFSYWC